MSGSTPPSVPTSMAALFLLCCWIPPDSLLSHGRQFFATNKVHPVNGYRESCAEPGFVRDVGQLKLVHELSLQGKKHSRDITPVADAIQPLASSFLTPPACQANDAVNRCSDQW